MADAQLVYLDTSAFVKLVVPEPETAAEQPTAEDAQAKPDSPAPEAG